MSPRINKLSIYWTNFCGTFFGGYKHFTNTKFDAVLWLAHTALLPASLTVGAGLKTGFDIYTRHELSDDELVKIKDKIPSLPDSEFDKFIAEVLKAHAHSKSSNALLQTLREAQDYEKNQMQLFARTVEEERLLKQKKNSLIKKPEQVVSSDAGEEATARMQFATDRRDKQRSAILEYIEEAKNAGKKTEHVLLQESEQRVSHSI